MINFNTGKTDEFACRCNKCGLGEADMKPKVLGMLDAARTLAGVPFSINRGISCVEHNEDVGGSVTSSHLLGWAIDMSYSGSNDLAHKLKALQDVGFNRIGIYGSDSGSFLHVDCDPHKPSNVIWVKG